MSEPTTPHTTTRRMNAYYYGFSPTGVDLIDAILEAVAIAGKGAHHTSDWHDCNLVQPIQDAADAAAKSPILPLSIP